MSSKTRLLHISKSTDEAIATTKRFIQAALDRGGRFFDTGQGVFQELKKAGVDIYNTLNGPYLRAQIDAGIRKFDYVSGSVDGILEKHNDEIFDWNKIPSREKEILDLATMPDIAIEVTEFTNKLTGLVESAIKIIK